MGGGEGGDKCVWGRGGVRGGGERLIALRVVNITLLEQQYYRHTVASERTKETPLSGLPFSDSRAVATFKGSREGGGANRCVRCACVCVYGGRGC